MLVGIRGPGGEEADAHSVQTRRVGDVHPGRVGYGSGNVFHLRLPARSGADGATRDAPGPAGGILTGRRHISGFTEAVAQLLRVPTEAPRRARAVARKALVVHAFAPLDGPGRDPAYRQIRRLWTTARTLLLGTQAIGDGSPLDLSSPPSSARTGACRPFFAVSTAC